MALQCGIVGLPNVGKSTLFNALTQSSVPAENYPFCTIDPHLGIVDLPDKRLYELNKIYNPKKVTASTIEFTDIAGLVKGASRGEGLGNKFLGHIRQTSAIIHVIRCFKNSEINHIEGKVDPVHDAEIIETELLLADIEILQKRKLKLEKTAKSGSKEDKALLNIVDHMINHCSNGKPARSYEIDKDLMYLKKSLHLLTDKPVIFVGNLAENELSNDNNDHLNQLTEYAKKQNNKIVYLCAAIEQEISSLDKNEQATFLAEYNLSEPGLNKVIRGSFDLLGLHTFFTCGDKEVRSWTIQKGIAAPKAAGTIHTDFERGFIKAEVFSYNDIIKYGSETELKNHGLVRQEGKKYIVKDGDCIYFKFNI